MKKIVKVKDTEEKEWFWNWLPRILRILKNSIYSKNYIDFKNNFKEMFEDDEHKIRMDVVTDNAYVIGVNNKIVCYVWIKNESDNIFTYVYADNNSEEITDEDYVVTMDCKNNCKIIDIKKGE